MANYTINDLLYLMARLRDPNQGCPWDLRQTSQTLIQHSIESWSMDVVIDRPKSGDKLKVKSS